MFQFYWFFGEKWHGTEMYISYVKVQSYTLMLRALLTAFPENSFLFRFSEFHNWGSEKILKLFFYWF